MERREKRALAFLLAASLLCLALVGLARRGPSGGTGRRPSSGPGREEFDRAAAELLAGNGPAELPRGVTEVTLYPAGGGAGPDRGVPLRRLGGWAPPPAIGGSAMCPQTS